MPEKQTLRLKAHKDRGKIWLALAAGSLRAGLERFKRDVITGEIWRHI